MANTFEEYVREKFADVSPEIMEVLLMRGEPETKWFLENYKGLIQKFKGECNRLYPGYWYKNERNDIAKLFNGGLGWYDWFCQHSALTARTEKYGSMIAHIVKEVPELGENTHVHFSQRYGNGLVDNFGIAPNDEDGAPYGYGIRISPRSDIERGCCRYYVYRQDRMYGGDYECDTINEVIAFIKKDIALWKQGYMTKEFDRETYDSYERDEIRLNGFREDILNRATAPVSA